MAGLPSDLGRDVHRTLGDLRGARLAATAWPAVAGDLARLASGVERGDEAVVRQAVIPVSQAAFEGKVRGRLAGADRVAPLVAPTKKTSALPLVGGVSALLLLVIGYLLGGWPVALVTAVLALGIFAVALAGTHTSTDRRAQRRAKGLAPSMEPTEPAPIVVTDAITRIEAMLDA
jgi:hypothetical protein